MAELTLTPQQQLAVESEGGALLVSAAAGSGKTKVLVERVMRRLCDPNAPKDINAFLMITYTKAAAAELRGKLAAAIGAALAEQPQNRHLQRQLSRIYLAQISTVHAFCAVLLREHAHELGLYPDFRMLEEQQSAQFQAQAMEQTLSSAYGDAALFDACRDFLDQLGAGRDDRAAAAILMQAYHSVQCHPDPEGWIRDCEAQLAAEDCNDMSETLWGKQLISDFRCRLAEQMEALERGLARLSEHPQVEEKYAPLYCTLLDQMRALHTAETWNEIYEKKITTFDRFPVVRGVEREILDRCKSARARCIEWLKAAQQIFSMPSDEALAELRQSAGVIGGMFRLLRVFMARYQAIKERHRALDFNDLEHRALALLYYPNGRSLTPVAREISRRYCEVMVDEYQDSNRVQDRIFYAVSDAGQHLFFVGDVKQSIYRFRLADPNIFLDKYREFCDAAEAAHGQPRRVVLSTNFRSHPEILSAVNDIFRLCMTQQVGDLDYGPEEALYPNPHADPQRSDMPRVELHCLDTSDKAETEEKSALEAQLVAMRVAELLQNDPTVKPSDIAILLRSPKTKALAYCTALEAHGIRAAYEQSDDILQTTEVSVLLSLLQVIDNPHQDIPLLSVLLSPVFGYDAQTLAQLRIAHRSGDLYDALCEAAPPFLATLRELRQLARDLRVGELVQAVFDQTDLCDVFRVFPDGAQHTAHLQTIYLMACAFDPDGSARLHDFLLSIERQRERGILDTEAKPADAVQIMSIHKSKGLEFPIVIVADLAKRFNKTDEYQSVLIHPTLCAGCNVTDLAQRIKYPSLAKQAIQARLAQERLSEELRVLYVALTRPKDRLIMVYSSAHLRKRLSELADRLAPEGNIGLSRSADSLGHWVLMAAMQRAEAGALFSLGGRPDEIRRSETPWYIQLWSPEHLTAATAPVLTAEEPPAPTLPDPLTFHYPHKNATHASAKLTATQLKGRFMDSETADGASVPAKRETTLRQPSFLQGKRPLSRAEQGIAVHLAMQYIRYEACIQESLVAQELRRLVEEGFLREEQAACVPPKKITALFHSPLGKRILNAPEVVREFKFSLLADAADYDPALVGEEVLLQGVTDCCLLEEDGLCVIDFKSDRVTAGQEQVRAEYYRGQLDAYSAALQRIFDRPVKEKILYFFATNTAVSL